MPDQEHGAKSGMDMRPDAIINSLKNQIRRLCLFVEFYACKEPIRSFILMKLRRFVAPMTVPLYASPDRYRPHIGQVFVLHHDGGTSEITLTEVKVQIDDEIQLCFSLFFSRTGAVLPQETYHLSHPVLGEFEMFLVPVQKRQNSPVIYQGGFNLLKEEAP
jgi:hypothetical protein